MLAELDRFVRARIELDLHGARLFTAISRMRIPEESGAASVAELAERRGLSFASAKEIEHLGLARFFHPDVEDEVRSRRMHVANAAVIGRIDMEDDFRQPADRWIEWARTLTPRDFLRKFRTRLEEVRQGRPVQALVLDVSSLILEKFRRARCLTSRTARRVLTGGQTLGAVLDVYLDACDPLRKAEGTRRVPDTAQRPESRYVPAEVRRRIRARQWDHCAVPWCRNEMFLEFSHRRSYCMGGDEEADNLDLLCSKHHLLYELGTLRIEGTTDDPIFKTAEGRILDDDGCDTDLYAATTRIDEAKGEAERRRRAAERVSALAAKRGGEGDAASGSGPPTR